VTTVKNVQSNVRPEQVTFDEKHVYVHENITEIEVENHDEEETTTKMYQYDTKEYEKDEFLAALSSGQVTLTSDVDDLTTAILEMSEVVYA